MPTRIIRQLGVEIKSNIPKDVKEQVIKHYIEVLAQRGRLVLGYTEITDNQYDPFIPFASIRIIYNWIYVGKNKVKDNTFCQSILDAYKQNRVKGYLKFKEKMNWEE